MHRMVKSCRDRYGGWPLRTAIILIGILEAIAIPIHLLVTVTNNRIVNDFVQIPEICYIGTGIIIGLIVAAALIYGAVKRNRYILWSCIVFMTIFLVVAAVISYGIKTEKWKHRRVATPTAVAFAIQVFFTLMVYGYIRELRDTENIETQYYNVRAPANAH